MAIVATAAIGYGGGYGNGRMATAVTADRPDYAGWGGGCRTAYIPYGWTWVRATNC